MGHHDSEITGMSGTSIVAAKRRMHPLFAQDRAAVNAWLFLDSLLGDERRKTGWTRAETVGDTLNSVPKRVVGQSSRRD
jgi:hypothetical protein